MSLTIFLIAIASLVGLLFLLLVTALHRTNEFANISGLANPGIAEKLLVDDSASKETLLTHIRDASGDLSTAKLTADSLVITITGFAPLSFSLDALEPVWPKFDQRNSSQLSYHAFELQRWCVVLFEQHGDERLIDLFWHSFNEWHLRWWDRLFGPLSWYDHCVGYRLIVTRYAMLVFGDAKRLSVSQYTQLLKFAIRHGEFLASDKHYDANTNHGLIVDSCLISAASSLPNRTIKDRWIEKAISRSLGRIDHYISDDGVPLEGSCSYWYLITNRLTRISSIADDLNVVVSQEVKSKLERAKAFLADSNINGEINRIGDTSGSHLCEPPQEPKQRDDGYDLHVLDSGLVYLNAILGGRVVSQLMLNAQDNPPYVHRHQDALSIGLYHQGVFWINSPGSFSTGKSKQTLAVKSWKNQSAVHDSVNGYSPRSQISECSFIENDGFRIIANILVGERATVRRTIEFQLSDELLKISDENLDGGEVVTGFLLNPQTEIDTNSAGKAVLSCDSHSLELLTTATIAKRNGFISYARNELEKTIILSMKSSSHSVGILLDNGLASLRCDHGLRELHRYQKRSTHQLGLMVGLARRLHSQRLKQVVIVWIGATLLVCIVVATVLAL